MIPLIIGEKASIPFEFLHYYPMLEKCFIDKNQFGKIGYLSIYESFVSVGTSHRYGGIHTEKRFNAGWGKGIMKDNLLFGGVFMASNVSD